MGLTVTTVLDFARAELGVTESPFGSNLQPYAACAGHANGYAWCATFAECMFRRAGFGEDRIPHSAYTPHVYNWFKERNQLGREPRPGAYALLYFPSYGRIAHCGITESVRADGSFVNIEGNTDEAGGRTGGKVMRKVRSRTNWFFGYPVYDLSDGTPAPQPSVPVAPPVTPPRVQAPAFPLPNGWYFGPHGGPRESVSGYPVPGHPGLAAWQRQMQHRGWRLSADGLYGLPGARVPSGQTGAVTLAFQREKGLAVDGKIGPNTWQAAWESPIT